MKALRTRTELVVNKLYPCTCGCHGRDPWHRSTYRRVVTKLSDTTGTVRLPFSTQPVPVKREALGPSRFSGREVYTLWMVDHDAVVWDKV